MMNMAHNYSPMVGSIVITMLFLCITPIAGSESPSITKICKKHNNPAFCNQILKHKQGSKLPDLATHVIDQIQTRIKSTKTNLNTIIQKTQDPHLIHHYNFCAQHYNDAMEGIEETEKKLKNRDYFGMNVAASAVMTEIDDCASSEAPGSDPSVFLVKSNQDLENLCVIVMIIANHLEEEKIS